MVHVHEPAYDLGKLRGGVEQVQKVLHVLSGLRLVGSTDPVADAAAVGDDPWLRDMVAKTILDNMVYPIAISLDRMFYLMRVRRDMERDEIIEWMEPRGFHFAKTIELQFFMEHVGYQDPIKDLGEYHQLYGGERSNWAYGTNILQDGESVSNGWGHGVIHAWAWAQEECFLTVRYGPVTDLPPGSFPPQLGECKHCGNDISPWTGKCSRRHQPRPAA